MDTTQTVTFTDLASMLTRTTERQVERLRKSYTTSPAAYAAQWSMRDLVTAETELALYTAAEAVRGEQKFVMAVARMLSDSQRSTDAFDRARGETEKDAALRALKNLRGTLSDEAKLALVDAL
jgi:hypothetical protein